jgi:FAD/FMN-containing dehydrogenase
VNLVSQSSEVQAAIKALAEQVKGEVFAPGGKGYDDEMTGAQTAANRKPDVIVGAAGEDDVVAAVRFAAEHGLPVAAQGTGHSLGDVDGGVVITTRRLDGVRVNADERTAWVEAGVPWGKVAEEAGKHGLAPLSGSAPAVCAVSYLLGGGLGLMSRRYGFGADHVRALDVVTADGEFRHVTAESEEDLFWALRGGRDNFGVVTGVEIDLLPVATLYGGGLFFDVERAEDVINAWERWVRTVPEEMTSSLAMVPFPDIPVLPEPLRGKHLVHIRIAYIGDAESGEKLVEPLRGIGPRVLEGLREMPYPESGSISNDPTKPMPYFGSSAMLSDLDSTAIHTFLELTGPGSEQQFIVELRHLGGAIARRPAVASAVGHRDAAFTFGALTKLTSDDADVTPVREAHAGVLKAMAPWTVGRCLNFVYGSLTPEEVAEAYDPDDYERLTRLKARFDPANTFRLNYNIPPA